jgi:hypothetical protein
MRRALALCVLLAGCGGSAPRPPGEVAVDRVDLEPGSMGIVVANGSDAPARLAQVAIDNGFVAYDGPVRTVAPHASTRLIVPYPWIAGQGYSVKVLTGEGGALEYRLDAP